MKGKILLSFLAGFALAAGAAFVLWRKDRKKAPPSDAESKPTESRPNASDAQPNSTESNSEDANPTEPTPPASSSFSPNPTETKPSRPLVGAQNPFATSPNPFGDPDPIIEIDPARSVELPIRPDGFTYRDLFIAPTGSFASYRLTIKKVDTSLDYRYGVADYNVNTGLATDIPERGWYKPKDGKVTFPLLFGAAFVVTSDGAKESQTSTPAQRFNAGRGVKVVAPGSDQFYIMRPVIPSAVVRTGNTLVIRRTSVTEQYALINLKTGFPVYMWVDGNGGDLGFDYETFPDFPMMAMTRAKDHNAGRIVPTRPMLIPGADPANTKTGFDERTGQGLLIIETTEGFAYAIAKENGEILTEKEKIFWSVTADTDDIDKGMTVTVNEWGFYAAPVVGNQIRFRVPPGGKYYMVTRLDDGTVVRSELLEVPSTGRNVVIGDNPQRGKPKTLIKIEPVSAFAEYATVDKRTGKVNDFVPPPKDLDFMRIETNIPKDQVGVVTRSRPFPSEQANAVAFPQVKDGETQIPELKRVKQTDLRRIGNEITVTNTAEDQEYALYVPGTVNAASKWEKPVNGEVDFLRVTGDVRVVTRKSVTEPLPAMTVQADGV